MTAFLPRPSDVPPLKPGAQAGPASAARSLSAKRSRLRAELARGNVRALRHGVLARVNAAPDVALEVEAILALHPGLEQLRDRRLVEQLAWATISCARCLEAIARDGMTPTLTSYHARFAMLAERLERAVHDRELERVSARNVGRDPFAEYRP